MANKQKKPLEAQVAETVLQTPKRVTIGDKEYEVAPPTVATLMMVSALVPELPFVDSMGNMFNETLAAAKDSHTLFKIIATLVLGAKAIRAQGHAEEPERRGNRRFWAKKREDGADGDIADALAREIEAECSPKEAYDIAVGILQDMELDSFFALSVSLQEVSLIQQTRAAGTTASGR